VIDLPDVQGIAKKTKFFVGDEETGVLPYNEMFRVEKWSEAYENQKLIGYVFCPMAQRVAVYLAFRDVVKEECDLRFEPLSWQLAKLKPAEVAEFAGELQRRGVNTLPAPVPEALLERGKYLNSRVRKSDLLRGYDSILEEMSERFRSYQPDTGEEVTRARVEDWLLQFENESILSALLVLEHIRFWDRAAMMDAFSLGLDGLGEDVLEAQWIPLGGATTSSHHLNYLWPDLKKTGRCPKTILASAAELQQSDRVVFYDDNVYSASQSRTVLQQWFGEPRENWLVNEEHVQPLSAEKLDVLKKAKIYFLFVTGRREGLRLLSAAAKGLMGHHNVFGHVVAPDEISCFRAAAGIFGDEASAERAKRALEWAGRKALEDRKAMWGNQKIEDRLLGYGNPGGLNVFYYNVPTSTITALWQSCKESSWMALFPRRRRE
jgi:hypothetical protein